MKNKNISAFERHFEKLVLATGIIFAITVIWFFGRSVTVEYKKNAIAPAQIERLIYEEALRLDGKVNSKEDPFPEVAMPPYARRFKERISQPLLGPNVGSFQHVFGSLGLDRNDFDPTSQSRPTYTLPTPPPAFDIVAVNEIGVLADRDILVDYYRDEYTGDGGDAVAKAYGQNVADQFVQIVDEQSPRDFHYVKIGAKYSMKNWRDMIEAVPVDRVPEEWWLSRLLFVDIVLERQTLLENGQWGSPEKINLLPGSRNFRNRLEQYDRDAADDLIYGVEDQWVSIARPPFPPLADDQTWRPPNARQLDDEEKRQLHRILSDIKRIDKQIEREERFLDQIADRSNTPTRKKTERSRRTSSTGGRTPGIAEAMMAMGDGNIFDDSGPSTSTAKRNARTPADKQGEARQRIRDLEQQRDQLVYDRDVLTGVIQPETETKDDEKDDKSDSRKKRRERDYDNYDDNTDMFAGGMIPIDIIRGARSSTSSRSPASRKRRARPTLEESIGDEVNLWAHDITVQPGKTYRYRLVVEVLNPLFARPGQLTKDQGKIHLNKPSIIADKSPWSAPVKIHRNDYFFALSAVAAQQSATVEVWRIFDGNWRVREFTVLPGEPVGKKVPMDIGDDDSADVDMTTQALMIDVVKQPGGRSIDMDVLFLDMIREQLLVRSAVADRDASLRHELLQEKAIRDADLEILGPEDQGK